MYHHPSEQGSMKKDGQDGGEEAASQSPRSEGRGKSLRAGLFSKDRWTGAKDTSGAKSMSASKATPTTHMAAPSAVDDDTIPRRFEYRNPSLGSSSDSGFSQPVTQLRASAVVSTASAAGPYVSTTDEDEVPSFYRPVASSSDSSYGTVPLQAQGPPVSLKRRRSHRGGQLVSLTVAQTTTDLALDDDWDYSETEWWGWVILVGTWLVFVVGMGSCFGVWSWAWDVGETPYAPPELEDDPTLPITGYYPALMICTISVAWIWVVVAWVGMKYFKHSKLTSEDG